MWKCLRQAERKSVPSIKCDRVAFFFPHSPICWDAEMLKNIVCKILDISVLFIRYCGSTVFMDVAARCFDTGESSMSINVHITQKMSDLDSN